MKERRKEFAVINKIITESDLSGHVLTFPHFRRPQRGGDTEVGVPNSIVC